MAHVPSLCPHRKTPQRLWGHKQGRGSRGGLHSATFRVGTKNGACMNTKLPKPFFVGSQIFGLMPLRRQPFCRKGPSLPESPGAGATLATSPSIPSGSAAPRSSLTCVVEGPATLPRSNPPCGAFSFGGEGFWGGCTHTHSHTLLSAAHAPAPVLSGRDLAQPVRNG